MQGAGAMAAGVREDRVGIASTGVIGVLLDGQKVVRGLVQARDRLDEGGDIGFADAIRTTDVGPKRASRAASSPRAAGISACWSPTARTP